MKQIWFPLLWLKLSTYSAEWPELSPSEFPWLLYLYSSSTPHPKVYSMLCWYTFISRLHIPAAQCLRHHHSLSSFTQCSHVRPLLVLSIILELWTVYWIFGCPFTWLFSDSLEYLESIWHSLANTELSPNQPSWPTLCILHHEYMAGWLLDQRTFWQLGRICWKKNNESWHIYVLDSHR
jgi:hypothetical protein